MLPKPSLEPSKKRICGMQETITAGLRTIIAVQATKITMQTAVPGPQIPQKSTSK